MDERDRQTLELIERLEQATRSGKADWRPSDAPGTYTLKRESGTVILSEGLSLTRPSASPSITFLDAEGEEVIRHVDASWASALGSTRLSGLPVGSLSDLIQAVKESRQTRHPAIDHFLEDI